MWLSIHWACLLTAHPPLPERLTAYSFHCFSQPPCPHAAIYIVNLKARWWFQNLWACLLTAPPPPKETHIPNLLEFNFLISNNHITSSPREAWGVFFKAYLLLLELPTSYLPGQPKNNYSRHWFWPIVPRDWIGFPTILADYKVTKLFTIYLISQYN